MAYDFIQKVIDYETGKMSGDQVLQFFCYIIKTGRLNERFSYYWLQELMYYGVITEEGSVNMDKLTEYKNINPLKL